GSYSFKAVYAGAGNYNGSTGACEPLTVGAINSSTVTDIHDAAHAVVTSVTVGTVVHDKATVTGTAAGGVPTGNVTFTWYTNGTCTGTAAATSSALPLVGVTATTAAVDATGFTQT